MSAYTAGDFVGVGVVDIIFVFFSVGSSGPIVGWGLGAARSAGHLGFFIGMGLLRNWMHLVEIWSTDVPSRAMLIISVVSVEGTLKLPSLIELLKYGNLSNYLV